MSEVKTDSVVNVSGDNDSGIDLSTNDVVKVKTANTERMRVTSDGQGGVVIGGTDPDPTSDGTAARAFLAVQGSGNRGCLALGTSSSAGADVASIRFNNGSDTVGSITVDSASGSTDNGTITVRAGTVNQVSVDSGSVGINQSAGGASARLHVNETNNRSSGFFLGQNASQSATTLAVSTSRNTTNSSYDHFACAIHGVATKLLVRDSGNVVNANNSYGSISDQRMKENIVDAASQWDDIKALQIRKYNRLGETQKELGVIAQELEASGMGGLVEEGSCYDADNNPDEETRKSVKYSVLYMKAVKALQEAMAKIETLETEMTALKARVTALEAGE